MPLLCLCERIIDVRAYLDIETTMAGGISIIGIYRPDMGTIQLIGGGVHDLALFEALENIETLVTFNGNSFDLPVIRKRLLVDLKQEFNHCDLMLVCRRHGLRGGLKRIEEHLGIGRVTAGIRGWDAPRLWRRYEAYDDQRALHTLLEYNREDVINLAVLEERIGLCEAQEPNQHIRHIFA